jgi:hypothetical protein
VGHFDGLRARRSPRLARIPSRIGHCPFRFVSFRASTRPKTGKTKGFVSPNETKGFAFRMRFFRPKKFRPQDPDLKIKSPRSLRDGWRWADKRDQIPKFRSIISYFCFAQELVHRHGRPRGLARCVSWKRDREERSDAAIQGRTGRPRFPPGSLGLRSAMTIPVRPKCNPLLSSVHPAVLNSRQ